MIELAASTPAGAVMTYVFPVLMFLGVLLWWFLQRGDNS